MAEITHAILHNVHNPYKRYSRAFLQPHERQMIINFFSGKNFHRDSLNFVFLPYPEFCKIKPDGNSDAIVKIGHIHGVNLLNLFELRGTGMPIRTIIYNPIDEVISFFINHIDDNQHVLAVQLTAIFRANKYTTKTLSYAVHKMMTRLPIDCVGQFIIATNDRDLHREFNHLYNHIPLRAWTVATHAYDIYLFDFHGNSIDIVFPYIPETLKAFREFCKTGQPFQHYGDNGMPVIFSVEQIEHLLDNIDDEGAQLTLHHNYELVMQTLVYHGLGSLFKEFSELLTSPEFDKIPINQSSWLQTFTNADIYPPTEAASILNFLGTRAPLFTYWGNHLALESNGTSYISMQNNNVDLADLNEQLMIDVLGDKWSRMSLTTLIKFLQKKTTICAAYTNIISNYAHLLIRHPESFDEYAALIDADPTELSLKARLLAENSGCTYHLHSILRCELATGFCPRILADAAHKNCSDWACEILGKKQI